MTVWNPRWLKTALRKHFDGQQLIVVANREPCVHELEPDGSIAVRHPISGLVTALDPVLRATGGTWIAHGSGSADRATVDRSDRLRVGDAGASYTLRRVWLTRGEERGYYHGFSNGALWPLCHLAFESPRFTRSDWRHYQGVNRRFADAVVAEAHGPRPIVLVQDYHFALLPALVRERLPNATIVAFWHIPWPNAARFSRLPQGEALVEGLLGSDIVGFQTPDHARAFLECVEPLADAPVNRRSGVVQRPHGAASVRTYPISIEWPSRWAAVSPSIEQCRRIVRTELGIDEDAPMMLAVDRLDYTKGIEERLAAIRRLLARGNATVARPVFVQVAAPSRTRLERYQQLGERVRAQAAAINERFGDGAYQPVILIERHLEPCDVFRLYRAADACHVNSLDDGMNLVAKEFVAARDDEQGVLLLSRFAGAARDLPDALLINPCDIDNVADAIADALTLPHAEQSRRMRAMRWHVADRNVFRWAGELLLDAASVRGLRAGEGPVAAIV
ncbi:MAG TPA: trehalose-6-phosphate synthase [Vicinamibacterales bacterium]|nr:trehalose-6-phosphate synthase [Vicinamibacterales bacterium]